MRTSMLALFGVIASVSATSTTCEDVYNQCIAEYTNAGQAPFFPECASRQAACEAGSVVPTTPVPTFPAATPSASSPSSTCDDVYNQCIAEYTNAGQAPFFPECASRRAACESGSAVPTATPSPSASAKCQDVYNQCIAEYTNAGQAPFFPECASRQAACEAGSAVPTATPSPSPSTSAKCQDVYNQCIAEYTNAGQSPFFPECNSRRAACEAGSAVPTTPVPTFPVATPSPSPSSSAKCDDVYNKCIAEYTNAGQSPFFPECNSRRAACQAGSPTSTPVAPPHFTGAAVAHKAEAALGFAALFVAAMV